MKKFLLTLIIILSLSNYVSADNESLMYQYDAAGNRISRVVVIPQPRQSPQEQFPSANITVTPTITNDMITIATTLNVGQVEMRYTLYSLQGNVLTTAVINSQQMYLSLGQYATGIYLLTVESESFIESFKIIKQ